MAGQYIILPFSLKGKKLHIRAPSEIADNISSLFPALFIPHTGGKKGVWGLKCKLVTGLHEVWVAVPAQQVLALQGHSLGRAPGTPGLTSLDHPGKSLTLSPWLSLSPLKNVFPYGSLWWGYLGFVGFVLAFLFGCFCCFLIIIIYFSLCVYVWLVWFCGFFVWFGCLFLFVFFVLFCLFLHFFVCGLVWVFLVFPSHKH